MEASGKLIENFQQDLAEINKYIQDSKRSNIKVQLEEIQTALTKQLSDEQKKLDKFKSDQSTSQQPTVEVKAEPTYITITKYAFENNKDNVKYTFINFKVYLSDFQDFKAHPKEKITANFQTKSFEIKIHDYKGKNFRLIVNNLHKEIKPAESTFRQINSGVVLVLKKEKDDFWDNLEKKQGLVKERDEKADKDKDPGAGLMDMMKEMYNNVGLLLI
jgi:calcyclin binding protein